MTKRRPRLQTTNERSAHAPRAEPPYEPYGEERLSYSEEGHAVLVYPDRLSEMPARGVKVPLGIFPPDRYSLLSLAPLTLCARTSDRVMAKRAEESRREARAFARRGVDDHDGGLTQPREGDPDHAPAESTRAPRATASSAEDRSPTRQAAPYGIVGRSLTLSQYQDEDGRWRLDVLDDGGEVIRSRALD